MNIRTLFEGIYQDIARILEEEVLVVAQEAREKDAVAEFIEELSRFTAWMNIQAARTWDKALEIVSPDYGQYVRHMRNLERSPLDYEEWLMARARMKEIDKILMDAFERGDYEKAFREYEKELKELEWKLGA